MGSAASAGSLSVPETWAAAAPAAQPATLAGSEWAAGEDQTTVATGMPAVASAGRGGYAVGPRYGVKPKVMPTQVFV
jgi:PPE-repeat protein